MDCEVNVKEEKDWVLQECKKNKYKRDVYTGVGWLKE